MQIHKIGKLMRINVKWVVLIVFGIASGLHALPTTRKRSRIEVFIPQRILSRLASFASAAQYREYEKMYLELYHLNDLLKRMNDDSNNTRDVKTALSFCSTQALALGEKVIDLLMRRNGEYAHLVARFGEFLVYISPSPSANFQKGYACIDYGLSHIPDESMHLHFEELKSYCENLRPDLCVPHATPMPVEFEAHACSAQSTAASYGPTRAEMDAEVALAFEQFVLPIVRRSSYQEEPLRQSSDHDTTYDASFFDLDSCRRASEDPFIREKIPGSAFCRLTRKQQ